MAQEHGELMARVDGWEVRLAREIEAARRRPFAWGTHDCATWAFDVAGRLTGAASAADAWRGRYGCAFGSRRVMLALGWRSLDAMGVALLGKPVAPAMAWRGDVVLGEAFGICAGAVWFAPGPGGLERRGLRDARMAWRV